MRKTQFVLEKLGFSEKEGRVYLTLLSLGPSPVRKIGEVAGVNRGTTYDALKKLQEEGLVSYYHKEKHQYFSAEDPSALTRLTKRKKQALEETEEEITSIIPELKSLSGRAETKPVVKYYENKEGIRRILEDVLQKTEESKEKEYRVYSSADIRPYLYERFPNFTKERIKRGIFVRVIAIGAGGKETGNSERKWLSKKGGVPTYTLIYPGKIGMISIDEKNSPRGILIENTSIFETQKTIFDSLWGKIKPLPK